ncbi:MAG: Outer membrane lipoprotein Blc precursor [Bacteroidetes bacterium ADurb.Bin035]|jgi:apolipoprotein D and lipocalin family protein|nr:lipocalin family protein [Patescibacteria group bacterium]OQC48547.1 MAG: Outer membrane lipoprotein Blc precursor [Bacteroidetes bacterium ADurb.Bin035]HNQ20706.1 lipocalin family protein [Bacteroidales bacterium]HOF07090.1 lipocalin family protein [Bacteroidales bacterium]HOH93517.1 lipocalin family protein [Bacteroidales bacterium]
MKTKNLIFLAVVILSLSCSKVTIPEGAQAYRPFDLEKYLGKWYEIARIDFKYESGLINTTAEYSLNKNGTVKVLNRGYDTLKNKWQEAIGKAKLVNENDIAMLKVSFFGPFYSGYNVISIDSNYNYALVIGESLDYLWILSRQPYIPDNIKLHYLTIAKKIGYDTNKILWISQN